MATDLEQLWQDILAVEPAWKTCPPAPPATRKAVSRSKGGALLLPGIDGYVDPALEGKWFIPRIIPGWEKVDADSPPAQLIGEYAETREHDKETWYVLRLIAQGKGTSFALGGTFSMRASRLITIAEAMASLKR